MAPNVINYFQIIIRKLYESFIDKYNPNQYERNILFKLAHCNTKYYGTSHTKCKNPKCDNKKFFHGFCHDKHCPTCQYLRRMKWVYELYEKILPVDYIHQTFILPFQLSSLALSNKAAVYTAFFNCIKTTLTSYVKKHYKGKIGFSAQLHTWGDQMAFHVHMHVITPNGYLSDDNKWVKASKFNLFGQKALVNDFKINMIKELAKLKFNNIDLTSLLNQLKDLDWKVNSKLVKKKSYEYEILLPL